ncbi:MAG: polynucleotide adenylyltransferase PcnB [Gammaproteobacteria bacterium]|nr:polynucleotide adenylyltransferase PcnB [Gammaproteobacteria bacterium]
MDNTASASSPRIIPRADHTISRAHISESARKVLYRLHDAGYAAYLVGGGVRDLLLGLRPKDFDLATNATPEQISQLFRNCRLIGRRFRLAHIHFGREIIEVATFRGHHSQSEDRDDALVHDGMLLRDNVYGTLEEDAWRRDFTVNALYYNIADFSLVDYTGGLEDLQQRRLKMIGDPTVRFQEDPVRMLRAIRFAAKLGFALDETVILAIAEHRQRLQAVPPARLFDELLKLFLKGHALRTYELLYQHDLLAVMFPTADRLLKTGDALFDRFVRQALINTDQRIHDDKPVNPAFLFAAMLWGPLLKTKSVYRSQNMSSIQAMQVASGDILNEQSQVIALPKRFRLPIREIWAGQTRLEKRQGRRASWFLQQPRFRAAYDFLLLRHQAGEAGLDELCAWWTQFQVADEPQRKHMLNTLRQAPRRPKPDAIAEP